MKKLFKFAFIVAIIGGAVYAIRKMVSPPEDSASNSGSGVIPSTPPQSLDDAPLGGQISDELLKILVCPEDKGALELVEDGKFLRNPRNGYKYPIRDGIPVMLIEEGKKFRDAEAGSSSTTASQNGTGPEPQESEEAVLQQ